MAFANIISTGLYVPEKIVTNDDLSRILGEDINEFDRGSCRIVSSWIVRPTCEVSCCTSAASA